MEAVVLHRVGFLGIAYFCPNIACVASVPVRAERNKGPRESFCIQDARKMGREQKRRGKNGPPSSFLLSPHFPHVLNAKIASRGPIFRSACAGTLATQVSASGFGPPFADLDPPPQNIPFS